MRITSKGQVTIPKEFRDKLGVKPGGEVEFVERNGNVIVLARAKNSARADFVERVRQAQELARKAKRIPMTDVELMELTRGPFNDLDPD
jgi:AbrB family looped-hinge helix DNA binding protein